MKKFLFKFLIFISPVIIGLLGLVYVDIFKVFGTYDHYYDDCKVYLNRAMVCTRTFDKYREREKYNSFILGSSRSQAWKCKDWKKYLNKDAVPFHFDTGGEVIWGISTKMQYIDEVGQKIDNALIIIDETTFQGASNNYDFRLVAEPNVSKESKLNYYLTFLNTSLSVGFLYAYTDYSLTGVFKPYMEKYLKTFFYSKVDDVTCDVWYQYDEEIKQDSIGYYKKSLAKIAEQQKEIAKSGVPEVQPSCKIEGAALEQTKTIKRILDKHKTNYKIVISPLFYKVPMPKETLKILQDIFGKDKVYDYSGVNEYTTNFGNYYETSHYRPVLAQKIMEVIYK